MHFACPRSFDGCPKRIFEGLNAMLHKYKMGYWNTLCEICIFSFEFRVSEARIMHARFSNTDSAHIVLEFSSTIGGIGARKGSTSHPAR